MTAGKATQIAWRGQDAGGNVYKHYLTLTGIYFDDANDNGIIEYDENATISYIDPQDGKPYSSHLWQEASGNLLMSYHNPTYDWFTGEVRLEMALSQGPRAVTAPFLMLLLED